MNGSLLLIIAGIVLGCQVLHGNLWGRLNITGNPGG